ncbi:DUF4244 domain-containing protein [Bifidobacterium cebidarum]|uniref:DUF4244 domain-containing protein n=1 Tax=Bifidobacterium cebidarum TaxID=2650773 RepID=A0A6I1GB26_9BIFI|nr:DUF4244 domain-containing protein [Bifidobacterium cebidarum]KAB7788863.1 hypothetical protein F7D08_0597 [Bifidobacterium cebidarum]
MLALPARSPHPPALPAAPSLKTETEPLRSRLERRMCLLDSQIRMFMEHPEEGAATAEYAVVLIAATGFAALLVAILKSDAVKTLLLNIVKKALNVG